MHKSGELQNGPEAPRTVIHVGMARAASTFLQQRVFPRIRGFRFFGVEITQYSTAFQNLLYLDDTLYGQGEPPSLPQPEKEGNILLSNELFTGQSLYLSSGNRTRNARRLKHAYPDAEIMLVLRNQVHLLESLYTLAVYAGHTVKPEAFIRFGKESTVENSMFPSFETAEYLPIYRYTPLIKLYKSLFEKVHVYLYEDFRTDAEGALKQWLDGMNLEVEGEVDFGERVNPSISKGKLGYIRKSNLLKPLLTSTPAGTRIYRQNVRLAEHGFPKGKKFHFAPALAERIRHEFAEDNHQLREFLPESAHRTLETYYGLQSG